MKKVNPDDVEWLLGKIKCLADMPNRPPTHRNIWAGSYDVWFCKQDEIDAMEIPKARMKDALDAGLIKGEPVARGKYTEMVYSLTEKGKALLNE